MSLAGRAVPLPRGHLLQELARCDQQRRSLVREVHDACVISSVPSVSGCSFCSALYGECTLPHCIILPPYHPRRQLCVRECLSEYEDLPDPPPEENPDARPLSPTHRKCPTLTILPDTCRWKRIYLKAKQLCFNWQWGVYHVLPLMRGHRKPVTSIACDGGCDPWAV